jgi:membrane-associated phospholipid phosphatase
MLATDGVSPQFEQRVAQRAPDRALRDAGIRFAFAAAYLVAVGLVGRGGPVHWLLAAVFVAIPITIAPITRLLADLFPFALFAALYDLLHMARPLVVARGVHVAWPYWFDKWAFGLGSWHRRVSFNELFAAHHWAIVDFVTGCAYLSYIYAVLLFAAFVAFVDRTPAGTQRRRALGWTFFGVNMAASLTYLLFPVAPPWYVAQYGFGPVDVNTTASPAALVRWDALVGVPYFRHFYEHASDVFGSMPSMHCAYPALLLFYALELRRPRLSAGLALFALLMCFSAVYLQHHYISDIVVGILYALLGYYLERMISDRDVAAA